MLLPAFLESLRYRFVEINTLQPCHEVTENWEVALSETDQEFVRQSVFLVSDKEI